MPVRLIECIPNFSEARRPEIIDQIISEITDFEGVRLLDRNSDVDHNRTVITFVGNPESVEEAAYKAIAKAAVLIDLNHHQGEHPRIGATDVVPFVPISGVSMVECVEIARRLGKRVGETLEIPVYLYEEAATRPERKNLEDIRHGQYEGLKDLILKDPSRTPDFGPAKLRGAGATVIGARNPLIAFNVYLSTDDVSIAEKIARRVRNSSGGLRYVKAMGVLVEGRAQVSMNLTNFKRTPMAQVTEMIRREAQRFGTNIHHSELVGLIPSDALVNAAQWYLQLDQFESNQILESRLFEGMHENELPSERQEDSLVEAIAAGTPTPGGGSASAHSAEIAAALVTMVGRLTVGKPKYVEVENQVLSIIEQTEILRGIFSAAIKLDSEAYEGILAARRMPKTTDNEKAQRQVAIYEATLLAAQVPLQVVKDSLALIKLAAEMALIGNINAISDAGAAGHLAYAAFKSAALNVRINLAGMDQDEKAAVILAELRQLESELPVVSSNLETTIHERGQFPA